ncbi:MAG: hypothetical protein ACFB15_29760 [Cyclobacteriaceae bacterium]
MNKLPIDLRLLIRTLGVRFYQENIGFFFVLLGFGLGILRPTEHIYLIQATVGSAYVLGIVLIAWGLFCLKAIVFTSQQLEAPGYEWIRETTLLPLLRQIVVWMWVMLLQCLLPTIYVGIIVFQAIYYQQWPSVALGAVFLLIVYTLGIWRAIHKTYHPGTGRTTSMFTLRLNRWMVKPVYLWFGIALLKQYPVSLLLTKLLSLGLLLITAQLYMHDTYDYRLLTVTVLASGFSHTMLMYRYHHFQHISLLFFRNLPISLTQRFSTNLLTVALILLPEFAVLLRQFGPEVGWVTAGWHIPLLISFLMVIYHSRLLQVIPEEKFFQWLFYTFVIYFLLIMFSIPPLLLLLTNFFVAAALFRIHYYHHEPSLPE